MKWRLLPFFLLWRLSASDAIPPFHGQTFSDTPVALPADLHGRLGILVIGFSKKSSAQTGAWNKPLLKDYGNDPHIAYYQCAVLADVPVFVRSMVLKSIRSPMPPAERSHFIPVQSDSSKWKEAVRFSAPDDAYILVVDPAGQIQWRTHGVESPDAYHALTDYVAALQKAAH